MGSEFVSVGRNKVVLDMERILRVYGGPISIPVGIVLLDSLDETLTIMVTIVVVSKLVRSITLVCGTIERNLVGFHEVKFGAIQTTNLVRVAVRKRIAVVVRTVWIFARHFHRIESRNAVAFLSGQIDIILDIASQKTWLEVLGHVSL